MNRNRILLILQSVLCAALVIALSVSAVGIYREGIAEKQADPLAWVYTREKAEAALRPILPLLLAAAGVTAACVFLGVRDENQEKPVRDLEINRDLLRARTVRPSEDMIREQRRQKKIRIGGWAGFFLCLAPAAIYMLNGEHFPNGDLEQVIASMAAHVFPWIILAFACLIAETMLQEKSIQREITAIQARVKEEKAAGLRAEPKTEAPAKDLRPVRTALLVLAVVFILLGIHNGSMNAVINKAIRICTECVGLG